MKQVKFPQLSQKAKQNTLNEIRILASLSHKNIIGYKDAFFDEKTKTLNIVMEYADDGDMLTKIKHNLKYNLLYKECVIWFFIVQILEGLNYLHENKIIHRDLKNANIFLTKDGTVKIGDLNVSKITKKNELATTQTGTPYYVAPEIWRNKPYEYKCDIWSLGCILYELCKLRPPFRGTNLKELRENIKRGFYEPIQSVYSKELKYIISLMLRQNPNERPSAKELLNGEIVQNKIKEYKLGNKFDDNNSEGFKGLIETIKMPKNYSEINNNLPNSKYNNNKQRIEEMLMEDEYETNRKKNGFLNEKDKKEIQKQFENHKNSNLNNNKNNINLNLDYKLLENYKINNNLDSRGINNNENKNYIQDKNNINQCNYNNFKGNDEQRSINMIKGINNNIDYNSSNKNNNINNYSKNLKNNINIYSNNLSKHFSENYNNMNNNIQINPFNNNAYAKPNINDIQKENLLQNNYNNIRNNIYYNNEKGKYNNNYVVNKNINKNIDNYEYNQYKNLNEIKYDNYNIKYNYANIDINNIINCQNNFCVNNNAFDYQNNYDGNEKSINNSIINKITPKFKSINIDDLKNQNDSPSNKNIILQNKNANNNKNNIIKKSKTQNKNYIIKNNEIQNNNGIISKRKMNNNKIERKSNGKRVIANNNNSKIQRKDKPILLKENKNIKQNFYNNKRDNNPFNIKAINYEGNQNYYDILKKQSNNNDYANNIPNNNHENNNYKINNIAANKGENNIKKRPISCNINRKNINNQIRNNNKMNNYNQNNNIQINNINKSNHERKSHIINRSNTHNYNYYNEMKNNNYRNLEKENKLNNNINIKLKSKNNKVIIEKYNYHSKKKSQNSIKSNSNYIAKKKNNMNKRAQSANKNVIRNKP